MMSRQIFSAFILSATVVIGTHNCFAQAQPSPAQNSTPQAKPAQKAPPAPHDHADITESAAQPSAAQKYFTDVELLNQNGEKVRFYTDVLKGKTVVVNAFFTTCTSVCPPMNRNMEKIQKALGERAGRDVFLVSMTVDPDTDTPARLKDYAQKFHAGRGWIFLTGKKENLDWALYKLGQYVENKDDHKTIFIIGNEPTGLWKKAFGMANVAELVQVVESVVNDKGAASKPDPGKK